MMRRSKQLNPLLSMLFLAASMVLMTAGCNTNTARTVTDCADAPADNCSAYTDTKGATCELDSTTSKCRAKASSSSFVQSDCQKITDKDVCQKDDSCLYKDDKCQDADANEAGKCLAFKVDTICNANKGRKEGKHCVWNATDSKCEVGPVKKVNVFTLSKIDRAANHNIGSDHLAGLTASKNGHYVYVVGDQAMELKAKKISDNTWANPGGNWNGNLLKEDDHTTSAGNLSATTITKFAPSDKGLLFKLSGNNGLVVVEGYDPAKSSVYRQGGAPNLANGQFTPFFANKAAARFIYAADTAAAAAGVAWRVFTAPPADDDPAGAGVAGALNGAWNVSLKKANPATALTHVFTAMAQKADDTMYLGDAEGVKSIAPADVGTDGAALANGGAPIVAAAALSLDGATANDQGITAMAMVGDALIIGLSAGAPANPNKGGIVIQNTAPAAPGVPAPAATVFGTGAGMTVNWIAVDTQSPTIADKYAVIGTDKGVVLFKNGALVELVPTKGEVIDDAYITANQADLNYRSAKGGFGGDNLTAGAINCVGAGQASDGTWYLAFKGAGADDGGVFTFKEVQTDVNP